ncbi:MAG: NYN domain-containing protein [Clostridia bacterium]|nr:NYN domain-containing protein [Clostridia bacterium]
MKENKKVAVFIDAENISARFADKIFAEASTYGDVIIRRVYADWSSPNVQAWKDVVNKHSLLAEQQFSAVKGKNSGDISLIINAMIVLFERDIDVFCLASSDSDFTRLVQVLREREKAVVGLGLKQTAQAFVNAFSEFIYLDSDPLKDRQTQERTNSKPTVIDLPEDRLNALKEVIDKLIEEDGWALFARIATELKNKFSDFVPRNYNCRSLKEFMIKAKPLLSSYEIQTDSDGTTMFLIPAPVCECVKVKTEQEVIKNEKTLDSKRRMAKTKQPTKMPVKKVLNKGSITSESKGAKSTQKKRGNPKKHTKKQGE